MVGERAFVIIAKHVVIVRPRITDLQPPISSGCGKSIASIYPILSLGLSASLRLEHGCQDGAQGMSTFWERANQARLMFWSMQRLQHPYACTLVTSNLHAYFAQLSIWYKTISSYADVIALATIP